VALVVTAVLYWTFSPTGVEPVAEVAPVNGIDAAITTSEQPQSEVPEDASGGGDEPLTPVWREHTVEEIIEEFDPSVCQVIAPPRQGSGFVVAPNLVATNEHVIGLSKADRIRVRFAGTDRSAYRVSAVAFAVPGADLVLLQIDSLPALKPIPVHRSTELRKGEQIVVIGSPGGLENAVTAGRLGSVQEDEERTLLQLSVAVNPGNSGGPAITTRGGLAGIVTLKSDSQEGIGFAIPGDVLIQAIKDFRNSDEQERRKNLVKWQAHLLGRELVENGEECLELLHAYDQLIRRAQANGGDPTPALQALAEENTDELRILQTIQSDSERILVELEQASAEPELLNHLRSMSENFKSLYENASKPMADSNYADSVSQLRETFHRFRGHLDQRFNRK